MKNKLEMLPPKVELESKIVLKQLAQSHKALAELKGYSELIPNKNILINAIIINEAKDSSEIENIVTTHDELFKTMSSESYSSPAAKEVIKYRSALWKGYELIEQNGFLSTNMIMQIHDIIEPNKSGIRKIPGVVLKNQATGKVIYTPPNGEESIYSYLSNLEKYINLDTEAIDELIKLAVIHYQFECIHPFYDGNGRVGRIINVLYLVLKKLLDSPILYLSKYIINNKSEYYSLLQKVTDEQNWEDWIVFILKAVEETAGDTLLLAKQIHDLTQKFAEDMQDKLPKIYSKELVDLLFFEFYTKSVYVQKGLNVSRKTAAKYLTMLEEEGFLESVMIGRERVYLNRDLWYLVKTTNDFLTTNDNEL